MIKLRNITILILLLFSVLLVAQDKDYDKFVSENAVPYNKDDTIALADAYDNYKMFIIGEYHYREENADMFLNVFRNLYKYANVRLIFMEAGYAHGLLTEHYLKTGNYRSLQMISEDGQFDEMHYRKLKDFYDILPADDKFNVVGVDLDTWEVSEHFKYTVEILFVDTVIPDELDQMIDDFHDISQARDVEDMEDSFKKIYFDWKSDKENYKLLLADNYLSYSTLMKRMKRSLRFDYFNYNYETDSVEQTRRETFMYRNVSKVVEQYPDCKYFGQFGLAHIGLSRFLIFKEEDSFESYIAKLNNREKSPLKDEVCSIAILYFDEFKGEYPKLYYYYSELSDSLSGRSYMPKKLYKSIKNNTLEDNTYILNISKKSSPLIEFSKNNFQYLIFER